MKFCKVSGLATLVWGAVSMMDQPAAGSQQPVAFFPFLGAIDVFFLLFLSLLVSLGLFVSIFSLYSPSGIILIF